MKILIPSFLKFAKINNEDGSFDIKPVFLLSEEELKKYKDKANDSVSFYNEKLTGFGIGTVFDASQTEMPLDAIEEELSPVLEDKGANEIIDCFIKIIYNDGFKVKFEEFHNNTAKGYCNHENSEIVVRKGLGDLMQMKVLIHEYAHALAHQHLKNNNKEYSSHRNKYETEAEAISYIVSKYLGMDTTNSSLSYLYAWSKNKDFHEIDDSLNTIVNYSKRIINNFTKFYDREFGLWADEYKKLKV